MLTNNEITVLRAAASNSFNYDNAEQEKADNATIFNVEEIATATGKSLASVRGIVGSLFKKGLFCETEEPNTGGVAIAFTDAGIDAFYALEPVTVDPAPAKRTTAAFTSGEAQPVRDGTKRAEILRALAKGATFEKIAKICIKADGEPWSKAATRAACQRFWLQRGIVIERSGEWFKLSAQHNLKDLIA